MPAENVHKFPGAKRQEKPVSYLNVVNKSKKDAELQIYGPIMSDAEVEWYGDGVSAKKFDAALKEVGRVDNIKLRIYSEGGSVTEARAIYTMLRKNTARINVEIEGIAASAATVIAMAGDNISIGESDWFMIHNASAVSLRPMDADGYEEMSNLLRKFDSSIVDTYQARTGIDRQKIVDYMGAETWFLGSEAKELGFVDEVIENNAEAVAASVQGYCEFLNLPEQLRNTRPRLATAKAFVNSLK